MAVELRERRGRGRPRTTPEGSAGAVQSLDRALALLRLVAEADGLSLTELAERADMAPSTVYRLLTTLQGHGIVGFQESEQRWQVGVETFRIGCAFLRRTKISEAGRAIMRHLMEATGETVNLGLPDGHDVVFVSQVETHQPIRAFFRPGARGPLHASGIGKALLAHLPDSDVDSLLRERGLTAFTEKTIVERAALATALSEIRRRGWSLDDEERTIGMRCVAAPIFNEFAEPIGGISVSGPSLRLPNDRLEEIGGRVKVAAAQITRSIGGSGFGEDAKSISTVQA